MTRRAMRDQLHDHLAMAALATGEALQRYKESARKVEVARALGPLLREAYAALELAEGYRQLTALETDTPPPVPPWK